LKFVVGLVGKLKPSRGTSDVLTAFRSQLLVWSGLVEKSKLSYIHKKWRSNDIQKPNNKNNNW